MKLTAKQTKANRALKNPDVTEVIFGGGAGGGKSALGCIWLIRQCLKYEGSRWVLGRSKLKALKQTTLNTFFDVAKELGLTTEHYTYNAQSNEIQVGSSTIILKDLFLYPSDPNFDSLGSLEITGAFVDECNQVTSKAWNILKSRCRYKLDEFGITPKMLGTCNPAKGWVYSNYYVPNKNGSIKPYRVFIQALATDNEHISEHYIENLKKLDNPVDKERLLYGNWEYSDDPTVLMPYTNIEDIYVSFTEPEGSTFISADIARMGVDKTVIFVWKGLTVIDAIIRTKQDTNQTSIDIKTLAGKYGVPASKIVIDQDGIGGGVVDQIPNCYPFMNGGKPMKHKGKVENYSNLKSQCYFHLAKLINAGTLKIAENVSSKSVDGSTVKELLSEELAIIKRKDADKDGKVSVIPKDKMKDLIGRSPDFADALMMRIVFDIKEFKGEYHFG